MEAVLHHEEPSSLALDADGAAKHPNEHLADYAGLM